MLFGRYRFHCLLEDIAILPYYKGSTFRGVFGRAMKKVVCALKRQDCNECLLQKRCVYALVFETQACMDLPGNPKTASPPHPYVIEPPLTTETRFSKGASFDFNLLLFGEVNHSIPYFIYAFGQMGKMGIGKRINGKRGRFVLRAVKLEDRLIYSGTDGRLNLNGTVRELSLTGPEEYPEESFRLKVMFETPLRLKFRNRLKADLPFHVLVRAMLRRVSALLNYYGNGEPPLDYPGLVKRAETVRIAEDAVNWFDWRRYSQRQDREMLMGGMIGSVTYEGKIGEYMPLVEFCTQVHLGKQTSFGLGKIKSEILE